MRSFDYAQDKAVDKKIMLLTGKKLKFIGKKLARSYTRDGMQIVYRQVLFVNVQWLRVIVKS